MNIKIDKKDDIILKILHYFITEEDYKPVIINGLENEIWLENMEQDLQLIRINTNYIHNNEQLRTDIYKAKTIMKSIKKSTFSLNINLLNLLLDTGEGVSFKDIDAKGIETIKVDKISDFKKNKVVGVFFPKVKDQILNEKMDPIEFFKLTEDMNAKTIKNEKKLAKIFSPKKPAVTYALLVINVMIYLFMSMYYGIDSAETYAFANNYIGIQNGEYYRLFTSMFLHANLSHLIFNMYALYVMGPQVERYYGKLRFLFVYILGGLMGSVFSCVFSDANVYGIGASGAIFALFGSVAYFTYHYRATLQGLLRSQIVPVILVNLILGFMIPGVDILAHVGGLIGGILVSMWIGIGDKQRRADQINGAIVYISMFLFMVYQILTK
jgi:rhomboid protease GluP